GGAAGHRRPRLPNLVGVGGHIAPALVRQSIRTARTVRVLQCDQVLVFELSQRRVHRPWARLPQSAATLADLLDDLIAVHRLLSQQGQRRRADVAALGPAAAPPRTPAPGTEVARSAVRSRHSVRSWSAVEPPAEARSAKFGFLGLGLEPASARETWPRTTESVTSPEPLAAMTMRMVCHPPAHLSVFH